MQTGRIERALYTLYSARLCRRLLFFWGFFYAPQTQTLASTLHLGTITELRFIVCSNEELKYG